MVIDSSALIALLLDEPETRRFVAAIAAAPRRLVSAASYVETAIVMIGRCGREAQELLDRLLIDLAIEVVPFDRDQAVFAVGAFERFGKGTGHAARLNLGDCFAYALAKLTGDPILFKGEDFSRTDLESAAS